MKPADDAEAADFPGDGKTLPAPPDPPERWLVVFEPKPSAVPAEIRIRKLLKFATRALDLKVVRVGDDPKPAPATSAPQPDQPARN